MGMGLFLVLSVGSSVVATAAFETGDVELGKLLRLSFPSYGALYICLVLGILSFLCFRLIIGTSG